MRSSWLCIHNIMFGCSFVKHVFIHLEGASILWTISQQLDDLWQEVCEGSNRSWKMESANYDVRLENKYLRIY